MRTIYTAEAKSQLRAILAYLETEWSAKARHRFLDKVRKLVKVIEQYPRAFPATEHFFEARRCVVVPQVSVYYRIEDETIVILAILDNRRDL